jgi:preprotein translocase subunit YajC
VCRGRAGLLCLLGGIEYNFYAARAAAMQPASGGSRTMIAQCATLVFAPAAVAPMSSGLLMMVAIFAIFYVLLIMPQQRRQKKWQQMLSNLKAGDRVTTSGGIIGIILSIRQGEDRDAGSIVLRVAPDNLKIEVARNAIASVTIDDGDKKS